MTQRVSDIEVMIEQALRQLSKIPSRSSREDVMTEGVSDVGFMMEHPLRRLSKISSRSSREDVMTQSMSGVGFIMKESLTRLSKTPSGSDRKDRMISEVSKGDFLMTAYSLPLNTTETLIEKSITQLQEHMTPAQSANLAWILQVGENWEEEAEELREEWRDWGHTGEQFRERFKDRAAFVLQREEENKAILASYGYDSRSAVMKEKFHTRFLSNYLLYNDVYKTRDDEIMGFDIEETLRRIAQ